MNYLLAILILCLSASGFAAKEKTVVETSKIEKTEIEQSLYFPMNIQSRVQSQITADAPYIVLKRLVKLGQKVKKNTPVLEVRNQDTSVHYEKRILRSPVDGLVASINVKEGQFVSQGYELIFINDPTNLYGVIEISAIDYKKVKNGLSGLLHVTNLDLKNIPIQVTSVGTSVDQLTGTVSAEVSIKDESKKLLPGITGRAQIILNKVSKIIIPEKSIYYIGEETFLPIVENNKIKKVKIKLGNRFKEKIEVLEGVELETMYVTDAPKFLKDGESVQNKQELKKGDKK